MMCYTTGYIGRELNMGIKDLVATVVKYAPALGAVLPLPGGAAIGQIIAETFGGTTDDYNDLARKIEKDPDAALKLQQINLTHQEVMKNIELQQLVAENDDIKSARQREVDVAKSGEGSDWVLPALSMLITAAFFASICLIAFTPTDTSDEKILYMLLGILGTAFTQVVNYYLGSSHKDNSTKDVMKILQQLSKVNLAP